MSSLRLSGSPSESHFLHPTAVILLPRTRFEIITGINHTIQNCKGEFIIKEPMLKPNNHIQQENISKHHELAQHSLFNTHIQQLFIRHIQQLFIIHPWIQSRLLRMMHASDLNSQMQCGTYRIQYQGNNPKEYT